jgi:ABC-type polar amino acid transport system ATPase subunit
MTCIIVTNEIAFAREVADQIYLVIEHAVSAVMTSPTERGYLDSYPPIARH